MILWHWLTEEPIHFGGLIVAAILAAYGVVQYRRGGWRRLDLMWALLMAVGVAVVSLVPQTGDFLLWLLNLQNRAFALLSGAVLLLAGLSLYLLGQVREASYRSGQLVRALAVREYAQHYDLAQRKGGVLIVVPAYNEAGSIREVLDRVPARVLDYAVRTVVVVDGATDDTERVVRAAGVPVAVHAINRGQGDALATGFEIARREEAEVVIHLDADGQYRPEEIDRLVAPIANGESDFVLGSRLLGSYEESGSYRHLGVLLFSRLISMLARNRITDCTNGFRAVRGSQIRKLDLREKQFSATELILEAIRHKLRIREVPVTMLRRIEGTSKKPGNLIYPFNVLRVMIKTWLR